MNLSFPPSPSSSPKRRKNEKLHKSATILHRQHFTHKIIMAFSSPPLQCFFDTMALPCCNAMALQIVCDNVPGHRQAEQTIGTRHNVEKNSTSRWKETLPQGSSDQKDGSFAPATSSPVCPSRWKETLPQGTSEQKDGSFAPATSSPVCPRRRSSLQVSAIEELCANTRSTHPNSDATTSTLTACPKQREETHGQSYSAEQVSQFPSYALALLAAQQKYRSTRRACAAAPPIRPTRRESLH
jgi:hypothetical protein